MTRKDEIVKQISRINQDLEPLEKELFQIQKDETIERMETLVGRYFTYAVSDGRKRIVYFIERDELVLIALDIWVDGMKLRRPSDDMLIKGKPIVFPKSRNLGYFSKTEFYPEDILKYNLVEINEEAYYHDVFVILERLGLDPTKIKKSDIDHPEEIYR